MTKWGANGHQLCHRGRRADLAGDGAGRRSLGALKRGLCLRTEIGDRTHLIEIHAALVHAALARQETTQATSHSETILALLTPEDRAILRQVGYFAAFAVADRLGEGDGMNGRKRLASWLWPSTPVMRWQRRCRRVSAPAFCAMFR